MTAAIFIESGSEGGDAHSGKPGQLRPVLCVDLDGTLVRTDTFLEAVVTIVRRRPYLVFVLPFWLLRGLAYLKTRVAALGPIDASTLPYNAELLEYLRAQRHAGRELALATASHVSVARSVADHLRIFSRVFATDLDLNLKGERKAAALSRAYPHGYAYAGNSRADIAVWRRAAAAVLVNVPASVRTRLSPRLFVEWACVPRSSPIHALWRALRPHQWVKNVLVTVPLITAHHYGNSAAVLDTAYAIVAVCIVASSIYLINDLLDLSADRIHPTKRLRALAAGDLELSVGIAAVPCLWIFAAILCTLLPTAFALGMATYAAAAICYSLWVKRMPWLDVIWLAGLYVLRIELGALAIAVPVSGWLFAFSGFAFLSLALLKRYVELDSLRLQPGVRHARGYTTNSLRAIERLGWVSLILAGIVLALYVNSEAVRRLYDHPLLLWPVALLLLYFLAWSWCIARDGRMHDDPVLFAVCAPRSYVILAVCLVLVFFAR